MQKEIQNILQVYFRKKKKYNLKMFRLYQIINSNINHSNMRGVSQKFEIMFQIPTMAV